MGLFLILFPSVNLQAANVSVDEDVLKLLEPPTQVTGLTQSSESETSLTLSWDQQRSDIEYYVELTSEKDVWNGTSCIRRYYDGDVYSCDNTETFDDLTPGTVYYVRVRAATLYVAGEGAAKCKVPEEELRKYSPYSEVLTCITSPKKVTSKITQNGSASDSVTFTWSPAEGAAGYYIYSYGSDKQLLATITDTQYTAVGLATGSSYRFLIQPYSVAGGKTVLADYTSVSNLVTTPPSIDPMSAKWDEKNKTITLSASAKPSYSYSGFETTLYDAKGKPISTQDTKTLAVTFEAKKRNTFYSYQTRGYKTTNGITYYSAYCNRRFVISAPTALVKKPTAHTTKLTWKKVTGATGYYVYRSTSPTKKFKRIAKLKKSKKSYTVKKLKRKRFYYYYVVAIKKTGGITYTSAKTTLDKRITYAKTK